MNDLEPVKVEVAGLSNEDLFRMTSEEIINYRKEEVNLAYEEMERRGILPNPTYEARLLVISPLGCLIGIAVFTVEILIADSESLPRSRAAALAAFLSMVAGYWHKPKRTTAFWKYCLWAAGTVLLGSFALFDLPNLLRQRIPVMAAFAIPTLIYSIAFYWLSKFDRRAEKPRFGLWLIACIIFTVGYSYLMSS